MKGIMPVGVPSRRKALEIVLLLPYLCFKEQVILEAYCRWKNAHKEKAARWEKDGCGCSAERQQLHTGAMGFPLNFHFLLLFRA